MTFDQINAATGFANGEPFRSEEGIRAYFTTANMAEMFGAVDGARYSQDDLDRMADAVTANRWHLAA